MKGRVVHFEVPFENEERARSFYSNVFGWTTSTMPELGNYVLVTTGPSGEQGPTEAGFINGGMMRRTPEVSGPAITLFVDDMDAALAEVTEHGGTVVYGKQSVGDMGFTGYVKDPEGNLVGLWASGANG